MDSDRTEAPKNQGQIRSDISEVEERRANSLRTFQPFQPKAEFRVSRRNLPHWTQPGVTYYVTFRLADSLPAGRLEEWKRERDAWLRRHPEPWAKAEMDEYERLFYHRLDAWLDAGHGECILARNDAADIVEGALHYFDGERYVLDAYVIMPNHVHLLVSVSETKMLRKVLHSWKSYTAHELNKAAGRSGSVWQDESFDHIVRSFEQLNYHRWYIGDNPVSARLKSGFRLGRGIGVLDGEDESE